MAFLSMKMGLRTHSVCVDNENSLTSHSDSRLVEDASH